MTTAGKTNAELTQLANEALRSHRGMRDGENSLCSGVAERPQRPQLGNPERRPRRQPDQRRRSRRHHRSSSAGPAVSSARLRLTPDIISSRRLSIATRRRTYRATIAELIKLTGAQWPRRLPAGQLRTTDLKDVQIAGRALVHGFARMNIDGNRTLHRWHRQVALMASPAPITLLIERLSSCIRPVSFREV